MHLKFISLSIILFSTLTLFGCSQPKIAVKDDITIGSIGNTATIVIEDIRPETDKEYSIGSLMLYSDNYGIWTLGDEMFTPNAVVLLKKYLNHETSKWESRPNTIKVKLKRLKFEANHQADLLAASSTQLGPLGVVIAEAMHGKEFEMRYDKNRPYVLGFIDADVEMRFPDGETKNKSLSAYKAENFSSHINVEGRVNAAEKTIKALYSTFAKSL